MRHNDMDTHCELTEAVLAHFLDGDCEDNSLPQREELRLHREECAVCRDALERARRLDALLATTAPRGSDPARTEIWIENALAARVVAEAVSSPRRTPLLIFAAAALLLVGLFGGYLLSRLDRELPVPKDVPPRIAEVPTLPVAPPEVPSLPVDPDSIRGLPAAIELPDGPRTRRTPANRTRIGAEQLAAVLQSDGWSWARPVFALAFPAQGDLADAMARRLAQELVAASRAELVVAALESLPDDFRLEAVCDAATRSSEFVNTLRSRIRSGERDAIVAGARLGGAEIDRALRDFVDGQRERMNLVVAAARTRTARPDRVALFLDLVATVSTRGAGTGSETETLEPLFRELGSRDAAQLAARLESSRSASDRHRALIALGIVGEPLASPVLLRALTGPRVEEAQIAAWSLGRMPAGSDDLIRFDGDPRRRALGLAALASRREPALLPTIRKLPLTAEERAFLLSGSFTLEQIPIAARLFRDRGATSD